jgi:vacuolar-type H+-ATPase subunit I/STV1
MSMECEHCKKSFSNKYLLTQHQNKAKYCLSIQGVVHEQQIKYECKYCLKTLCSNERLYTHFETCKEKQKKEYEEQKEKLILEYKNEIIRINQVISEQKDYISKLEAKLEKFEDTVTSMVLCKTEKKATTNTTNNTTNIVINALNLNDIPKMAAFLEEKLDKDVVAGGQKGLALLLSNTVLKDKYKCVDPSRQNFEFTNELGEVERDVKAKKLTNALIKSDICAKAGERGMQLWKKEDGSTDSLRHDAHSKKVLEMIMFSQDNSTFRSELTALTS